MTAIATSDALSRLAPQVLPTANRLAFGSEENASRERVRSEPSPEQPGSTSRWLTRVALGLFLGAAWTTTPSAADWLVLTTGEQIETRGSWEVKEPRVLFTNRTGQYISIDLTDVDVAASKTRSYF